LAACAVAFAIGLIYSFLGYRFFKVILFMTGLVFGTIIIYVISDKERLLPNKYANAGLSAGGGVLFGLITMLVEYVGLFLTGFLGGLFVGCVGVAVLDIATNVDTIWATIGVLFCTGLIFALVTLKWSRKAIILQTALMGGALILFALDYTAQKAALLYWLWSTLNMRHPKIAQVCWYSWAMTILWPAVTFVGCIVQSQLTAATYSHKDTSTRSKWRYLRHRHCATHDDDDDNIGRSHNQRVAKRIESHRERKTTQTDLDTPPPTESPPTSKNYRRKSFRSLYQARQKHGDVICQV